MWDWYGCIVLLAPVDVLLSAGGRRLLRIIVSSTHGKSTFGSSVEIFNTMSLLAEMIITSTIIFVSISACKIGYQMAGIG